MFYIFNKISCIYNIHFVCIQKIGFIRYTYLYIKIYITHNQVGDPFTDTHSKSFIYTKCEERKYIYLEETTNSPFFL